MAVDMRRHENLPDVHTTWEHRKLWKEEEQKWLNWLPWLELPDDFFAYETDAIKSWLRNPHRDPWKLHEGCKDVSVPNLDIVGWYDHANGDMLLFRTMVKEGKTGTAREGSRIIIGPWTHGFIRRRMGNIDFGPGAELDKIAVQIRWFDYWLKGKQSGVDKDAPVRIFVMGDNKWRDQQHWPLRRTKNRILFITSDGRANTPGGDGKLADKKPQSSGTDKYVYDPNNPVPTPYGAAFPRAADQRSLAEREDILVYQTEPLTERIEITGNPILELHAASSTPDTDWFVRLIDVAPDGLARAASSGMVRARYRNGFDKPKLIQPGEVVKYRIRMNATSNAFLPGHRIRVDITSSDFPNYDRNHNTAFNQNADVTLAIAEQTVYHGGRYATKIILPWLPNPPKGDHIQTAEPAKSLFQAAANSDTDQVKLLISKGADVNAVDKNRVTALHTAAEEGDRDMAALLIGKGADVNAKDKWVWTPLHYACWKNHKDAVEFLLANGADINAKDKSGQTPLYHTLSRDRDDVAKLLLAKGAYFTWKDKSALTALHYAAVSGYQDIAELLLAKGAKVNEKDDVYEFTALHYAARFGHRNVAELLIAKGADINAKDKWDYQPIHVAAHHDRADVVELLISKGADINAKTSLGQTALQLAEERRNTETIELLRKHGAKE